MPYDNDKQLFAKLPQIHDLDAPRRDRIITLLERLDEVNDQLHKFEDEKDDIFNELVKLQEETARTGFRYGWLCFTAQKVAGRKTLDKLLLMENGCPAAVIKESYKEGNPSIRRMFYRLREEDMR